MRTLHHVKQTDNTCGQACLAMLLNCPLQIVVDDLGDPGGLQHYQMLAALSKYGFDWWAVIPDGLICDGFYILTVPSLNLSGGGHYIVVAMFEGIVIDVLDPNMGIEGKRYYTKDKAENPLELQLYSWSACIYISPKVRGKMPARK